MPNSSKKMFTARFVVECIPECFKDLNFKDFDKEVTSPPDLQKATEATEIELELLLELNKRQSDDDSRTVLNAFARSNFLQHYGKKIKSLKLSRFYFLDNWKPFLETFIQCEAKMFSLELGKYCRFTQNGARTFAWLLDNEKSGLEIKSLKIEELMGDKTWVFGLDKNTTLKKIRICDLDSGVEFFDYMRRCNPDQYDFIRYYGGYPLEGTPTSIPDGRVSFKLGRDGQEFYFSSDNFYLDFEMNNGQGEMEACIGNGDIHNTKMCRCVTDYSEKFRRLFPIEQPEASLQDLTGRNALFQVICAFNFVPLKKLELKGCDLTEQDASHFGWLLDTETSGVNLRYLRLSNLKGSKAWASGLYKNKSIQSFDLTNYDFWHSIVHWLRHGRGNKLTKVNLESLSEEKNKKPYGVHDGGTTESMNNKNNTAIGESNKMLSFKEFVYTNRGLNRRKLSSHLCKSIGNMLRRTKLDHMWVENLRRNLDYDFFQDAVLCKCIVLTNTAFDPLAVASLINGGQLKEFALYWQSHYGECRAEWKIFSKLLEHADLTFLDEFRIGENPSSEAILALCHQFKQNKGPRKFGKLCGHVNSYEVSNDSIEVEGVRKLAASLAGNTRIQEFQLQTVLDYGPREILEFVNSVTSMPSLTKLDLYDYWWGDGNASNYNPGKWRNLEKEKLIEKVVECEKLILKHHLLGRNVKFDFWPPFMMDYNFTDLLEAFGRCKKLLRCDTNDLPDCLWTHVFVHATNNSSRWPISSCSDFDDNDDDDYRYADPWMEEESEEESEEDDDSVEGTEEETKGQAKDLLFYLVKQLPRLFQHVDGKKNDEPRPSFIVPHHPNCPACRKRKLCSTATK